MCSCNWPEISWSLTTELRGMNVEVEDLLGTTLARLERHAEKLRPLLCDVSLELNRAMDRGESVLFEGAQGALLDIDHGTYPFVTSSSSTAGGAAIGTGVAPRRLDGVVGILKAYTTRVGEGPFPTELLDDSGEHLRERGREFGTTTGRPRRCGWLDLVIARYGCRVNGVGSIALTKLDVLDALAEIPVCTGYRIRGEVVTELPSDTHELAGVEPIYRMMKGWQSDTAGILDPEDLPQAARDYIDFIEQEVAARSAWFPRVHGAKRR